MWTASSSTCRSSRRPTSRPSPCSPSDPDGLHVLRHSTRARARAGRLRPLARHAVRDRAGDRGRLLLRPRAPGPISETDLPKIEDRMREIVGRGPTVRPRGALARRGARAVRRPAVQARDRRDARGGRGRRRRDRHRLPQRRVGGPVPRAARAVDGPARRVHADEARRRVLARRRVPPDAHADLRHGVGDARTTSTPTCAVSRRPRSATIGGSVASSTCSRARTSSGRVCGSGTRAAGSSASSSRTTFASLHLEPAATTSS